MEVTIVIDFTDEILYKAAAKADRELMAEFEAAEDPHIVPGPGFDKRMRRLLRKSNYRIFHPYLLKGLSRVASIILCTALALSLTAAVTYAVHRFLYTVDVWETDGWINEQYHSENEGTLSFREPEYMTEGYSLINTYEEDGYMELTYENDAGEEIIVTETDLSNDPYIATGTEDIEFSTCDICGFEATIEESTKYTGKAIYWNEENISFYIVSDNTTVDELKHIAEGFYR